MKFFFLSCLCLIACPLLGQAQQPNPSPTPPPDRPIEVTAEEIKQFEESLKPYVEKARQTYPEARKRYLAGLPKGQWFSVTTKIYDEKGRFEGVFIEVKEIKDGVISGVIANEINVVTKYKLGDAYTLAEKDLLDWTISHPDGTEEGNFVGKYIESLQRPRPTAQPQTTTLRMVRPASRESPPKWFRDDGRSQSRPPKVIQRLVPDD